MKLILLRHGNRDLGLSSDSGLNQIGKDLATSLSKQLQPAGKLPIPSHLIASPKRRAQETLQPLSKFLGLPLMTEKSLDERHHDETSTEFRLRVKNYLEAIPKNFKTDDVIYLCSHADWLEDAMFALPSDCPAVVAESGFACGEFRFFELTGEIWKYLK